MPELGRAAVLGWQRTVDEAWQRAQQPAAAGDLPTPPPKGATPQQHADYLRSLTDEQLRTVAGRDGLAADLRDQANRMILGRERDGLRTEIAALRAKAKAAVGPGGDAERLTSSFRADQLQGTLNTLDGLANRIGDRAPGDDAGRFLLDYDSAGDGRAIVATHNPDTAANVATLIPGASTTLGTFDGTVARTDALHGAATRAGSPSTSVVAWLDYDAPEPYLVGGDIYARDASDELDSFQDGLRASHLGAPSHNTVVGHSYGALVAGIADHDTTLAVDDLVSAGGTGLGVRNAEELAIAPDHVWATEAGTDNVADVGRALNGRVDAVAPEFGARVFASDAPVPLPSEPHSQYFDDTPDHSNTGLNNIGDIIAGRKPSPR